MIVIHYPTAFKALDCFIDLFNEKAKKNIDRLRTGAVMTAKEIIRIYGISLLKANGCQEINQAYLPSLQTNNHQLSKLVKCSSRTIQRHIIKLQTAGIITNKKFHGSNSNYELWINPSILLVKQKIPVEKIKQQLNEALIQVKSTEVKSGVSKALTPNCLDTYSGNTRNINNILIAIDNSGEKAETSYSTGNSSGNTGEIVQRAESSGHRNVAPESARGNSLSLYVSLLWLMARNLLYKEVDLTDRQVLIAKKLIRKLYEPARTENLFRVHQHYVARISLVFKFIQRDPTHRFVTLPYLYFDTNNSKGFIATKQWYLADLARKKEVERELVLGRVIRNYQNNEKKEIVKRKPAIQLFRECENTIGKFNDPSLTERFHAAVLEYETYRQISYKN